MKKNILFCLFIILFQQLNGQLFVISSTESRDVSKMNTVDSGNIRILYALNATDIKNETTYDDLICLETGERLSKCYSRFIFDSDSLCTEWNKAHKHLHVTKSGMGNRGKNEDAWTEYKYSDYIRDFSKNTLTGYVYMPMVLSNKHNCRYDEDIPQQDWTLCEETDTIIDYLCQKATCRFRGRDFTAWFTPDIPINNGPWKFGGLPGLILKVYDNEKHYVFECIKIENHRKKYPIKLLDYKGYAKKERREVLKFIQKIHKNYYAMAGITITSGSPSAPIFYHLETE